MGREFLPAAGQETSSTRPARCERTAGGEAGRRQGGSLQTERRRRNKWAGLQENRLPLRSIKNSEGCLGRSGAGTESMELQFNWRLVSQTSTSCRGEGGSSRRGGALEINLECRAVWVPQKDRTIVALFGLNGNQMKGPRFSTSPWFCCSTSRASEQQPS